MPPLATVASVSGVPAAPEEPAPKLAAVSGVEAHRRNGRYKYVPGKLTHSWWVDKWAQQREPCECGMRCLTPGTIHVPTPQQCELGLAGGRVQPRCHPPHKHTQADAASGRDE